MGDAREERGREKRKKGRENRGYGANCGELVEKKKKHER